MVIARNPETSDFSSMPSSAIATGLVDFILEPTAMPDTIEGFVQQHAKLLSDDEDDEKNLVEIIELIKQQSPLDFTDYKHTTILRRIKRRATYNNFTHLKDYVEFLKTSTDEVDTLAQDFLISVTSFFRDKEAYQFIETDVIPNILKTLADGDELKLWVAGCATGEEAYSLAILICEQLIGKYKNTVVKIFATDIDNNALEQARKAVYKKDISKDVSPSALKNISLKKGIIIR